jgi:hypothetical protein
MAQLALASAAHVHERESHVHERLYNSHRLGVSV